MRDFEKSPYTRGRIYRPKIRDVVQTFALLHADGIGLSPFRLLPQHERMKAIDNSKRKLAYEMDGEIDAAHAFIQSMKTGKKAHSNKYWVCSAYLVEMYPHWARMTGRPQRPLSLGALAVGALLHGQHLAFTQDSKPQFWISVTTARFKRLVKFLERDYELIPWEEERYSYKHYESREDEQENELQSVDATEEKEEEDTYGNRNSVRGEDDNTSGEDIFSVRVREGSES